MDPSRLNPYIPIGTVGIILFLAIVGYFLVRDRGSSDIQILFEKPVQLPTEIPTLEQLEEHLKILIKQYPAVQMQEQRLRDNINVVKGAIAREKQLKGILIVDEPATKVDISREESEK